MDAASTVYFNGACPVCRREIGHYRRLAARAGLPLAWHDVSAAPGALAQAGIDDDRSRRRLHALTPDGRVLAGIDAFAALWRALPGWWPALGRLAGLPVAREVLGVAYEAVAWVLYRLDRRRCADACRR